MFKIRLKTLHKCFFGKKANIKFVLKKKNNKTVSNYEF